MTHLDMRNKLSSVTDLASSVKFRKRAAADTEQTGHRLKGVSLPRSTLILHCEVGETVGGVGRRDTGHCWTVHLERIPELDHFKNEGLHSKLHNHFETWVQCEQGDINLTNKQEFYRTKYL